MFCLIFCKPFFLFRSFVCVLFCFFLAWGWGGGCHLFLQKEDSPMLNQFSYFKDFFKIFLTVWPLHFLHLIFFSFKYSSYKKHILKIEEKSQIQWKEDFFLTYNRSLFFLSIFTFCFFNANHDLHFCRNPLLSCETANLKHRRLSNSDTAV